MLRNQLKITLHLWGVSEFVAKVINEREHLKLRDPHVGLMVGRSIGAF